MTEKSQQNPTRSGVLVLRGASMTTISLLFNVVASLALLPFILNTLGTYWFGIWMLVGSIVVQYQVLDFGMQQTVVRYVSQYRSTGDHVSARQVYSTVMAGFLGVSLFTVIVLIGLIEFVEYNVDDPEKIEILFWVIVLIGFAVATSFPSFVFDGAVSASLRQDILGVLQLLRAIFRYGLTFWVLYDGYGIIGMAVVTAGVDSAYRILIFCVQRRVYPEVYFERKLVSWKLLRELLRFGQYVFVINISRFTIIHANVVVVSGLIGVNATALYSIGLNVIYRLEAMIRKCASVIMPAFASIAAQSDNRDFLRRRFLTVARLVAFVVSMLGGGLIFVGYDFIKAWVGPEFSAAYWPMMVLMIAWIFELSQVPALMLLTALGQHRRFAHYDAMIAVASILGAIALAVPFGIVGVAFGVGLPVLISGLINKPRFLCRALEMPLRVYLGQIGYVIGTTLLCQVPVWFVLQQFPGMNLLELFVFGCLTYGPVGVFVLLVILPRADQKYMIELLPSRINRIANRVLPHLR